MNNQILKLLRVAMFLGGLGIVALAVAGDIKAYVRYFGPLDLMLITSGIGLMLAAIVLRPSGFLMRSLSWLGGQINVQPAHSKVLSILMLSLVLLAGWVMVMEGVLTLGMRQALRKYGDSPTSWAKYYATLAEEITPCWGALQPAGSVSVAVFGESSANGWGATESFASIMMNELPRRYAGHKFCITNFAGNGQWLHGNMAVIAKFVIKDFDILIFYQGHNELIPFYKNEVFIKPEFRGLPAPAVTFENLPFVTEPGVLQEIELHSRLYSVLRTGLAELAAKIMSAPVSRTMAQPHGEFELNSWVPPDKMNEVLGNWKADLVEIAELAQEQDKLVVLSSMPGNEAFPPFFSVYKTGITETELKDFRLNYQCGVEASDKRIYGAARDCWLRALAIDDHVSILNWRIGNLEYLLNDRERARKFWRKSIDQDGWKIRSIGPLHEISKWVSEQYENVIYVDAVAAFHEVEDVPVPPEDGSQHTLSGKSGRLPKGGTHLPFETIYPAREDLFADAQHPSHIGHRVLAEVFMCALGRSEPLRNFEAKNSCAPLSKVDWRSLGRNAPDWEYKAIFWLLSLSRMSAYPAEFLNFAELRLDQLGKSPYNTLIHALFRAVYLKDKSAGAEVLNNAMVGITSSDIAQALDTWRISATLQTTMLEYGFGWSNSQSRFESVPELHQ